MNYVSAITPGTDSGVFAAVATHLLAGKIPYAGVFDHKPPMTHLLDALALFSGGGYTAIRIMEAVFGAAGSVLVFLILWRLWNRIWIGVFGAILFVAALYNPLAFELGNLTEEYGAIFLLAAVFFAVGEMKSQRSKYWQAGLAAFFSALAALCKEPFALSALPWLLMLIPVAGKLDAELSSKRVVCMVAGGLIPVGLVLAWLWVSGGLMAFIDVLSYNTQHSSELRETGSLGFQVAYNVFRVWKRIFADSFTLFFLCGVGTIALTDRTFRRQNTAFQIATLACVLFSFVGTMISGRGYGHYYMQMVPSLVLLAGGGMAWMDGLVCRKSKAGFAMAGLLALLFVAGDFRHNVAFAGRMAEPFMAYEPDDLATKFLNERLRPGDLIWVPGGFSYLYLTTGHLSPTRYIYAFRHLMVDTLASTGDEKKQGILDDLKAHPPRFIVLSEKDNMALPSVQAWMEAHYSLEKVPDSSRKDSAWLFYEFKGR